MIWRLGLEQLRANRGYFVRTVSLLALLVAVLTHVIVIGATQAVMNQRASAVWGGDLSRQGYVMVTDAGAWPHHAAVTPAELRSLIDATPGAAAFTSGGARTVPVDEFTWTRPDEFLSVLAVYGARDAEALLASGRLPEAAGEVALASDVAETLGWSVGDDVTLYADVWVPQEDGSIVDEVHTYELVGLLTPTTMPGFEVATPAAVLAWADVERPDGLLSQASFEDEGVRGTFVQLGWDGPSPALDRYLTWEGGFGYERLVMPQASGVWFALAAVLAAAMVIMSFAVGRSQAATRSGWIATARTLGATKRQVAWATVAETVVMAGIALVAGIVAGIVAAQAQLSIATASSGVSIAPTTVSLHWSIVPTVAFATLLVTVAIAAIPAFWAARVPPVAALKPVSDITEAELSRRVSPHWLWIPTVLGMLLIVLGNWQPTAPLDAVIVAGMIMAPLGIGGLSVEAARGAIPWAGRRLAASASPSRLTAGDALATRPRQAVAPALATLTAIGVFTVFVLNQSVNHQRLLAEDWWMAFEDASLFGSLLSWGTGGLVAAVVLGAVMIQLVTTAIFVAHRSSTRRETATRRALGLSTVQEERAQWWQQMVPQVIGAALGLAIGGAVFAAWQGVGWIIEGSEIPWASSLAQGAPVALIAAATLLAAAALAAWASARSGRTESPLSILHGAAGA